MTTVARPSLAATIASHPIAAYVVIAYAVSGILTLLLSVSLVFGLLALFGPTLAAVAVTRSEGTYAELRERITAWRQPIVWYVLAFGVPFVVAAIARLILTVARRRPGSARSAPSSSSSSYSSSARKLVGAVSCSQGFGRAWAWRWPA